MSTTKTYIGTKVIHALPMTRQAYNDYRGWQLPDNEDGADDGYLVEYVDGGKANDPRHAGYISWSPKDVFERPYRASHDMTFGQALEALKVGQRVSREGWNGKGQFVYLVTGESLQNTLKYGYGEYVGEPTIQSALAIKTTANQIQVGWLASQTDMLAEDWEILP